MAIGSCQHSEVQFIATENTSFSFVDPHSIQKLEWNVRGTNLYWLTSIITDSRTRHRTISKLPHNSWTTQNILEYRGATVPGDDFSTTDEHKRIRKRQEILHFPSFWQRHAFVFNFTFFAKILFSSRYKLFYLNSFFPWNRLRSFLYKTSLV